MSVKVGLGTSSSGSPARARMSARAKVVLPAPSPPERVMRSPGRTSSAIRRARRSVASWSDRVVVQGDVGGASSVLTANAVASDGAFFASGANPFAMSVALLVSAAEASPRAIADRFLFRGHGRHRAVRRATGWELVVVAREDAGHRRA